MGVRTVGMKNRYPLYSLLWLLFFAFAAVLGLWANVTVAALLAAWRMAELPDLAQVLWGVFGGLIYMVLPARILQVVIRLESLLLTGGDRLLELLEEEVSGKSEKGVPPGAVRAASSLLRRAAYILLAVGIVLWGLLAGLLVGLGIILTGSSVWGFLYALAVFAALLGFSKWLRLVRAFLGRQEARGAIGTLWRLGDLLTG